MYITNCINQESSIFTTKRLLVFPDEYWNLKNKNEI
jgi:hypothetical protein